MNILHSLSIRWSSLRAMLELASTDETRYVINGVCVELRKGSTRLIATDGWLVGVLRLEERDDNIKTDGVAARYILPPEFIRQSAPSANSMGTIKLFFTQEKSNSPVIVEARRGGFPAISMRVVDGNFPDYKQCYPSDPTQPTQPFACVNPALLQRFLSVSQYLQPMRPKNNGMVMLSHGSMEKPFSILLPGIDFHGLLMPIRCDGKTPEVPLWVRQEFK